MTFRMRKRCFNDAKIVRNKDAQGNTEESSQVPENSFRACSC